MRIYLAGPMRGYPGCNFASFDAAKERWTAAGHHVISPADVDRALGYLPSAEDPTTFIHNDRADALVHAAFALLTQVSRAEAVALLEGWERSAGATMEVAMAFFLRLPFYDAGTMSPVYPLPTPWAAAATPYSARADYAKGESWEDVWRRLSDGRGRVCGATREEGGSSDEPASGVARRPEADPRPAPTPTVGSRPRSTHVNPASAGPARLSSVTEGVPDAYCSFCGTWFYAYMERIQTLDRGPRGKGGQVTLCRGCYDKAGNTVR